MPAHHFHKSTTTTRQPTNTARLRSTLPRRGLRSLPKFVKKAPRAACSNASRNADETHRSSRFSAGRRMANSRWATLASESPGDATPPIAAMPSFTRTSLAWSYMSMPEARNDDDAGRGIGPRCPLRPKGFFVCPASQRPLGHRSFQVRHSRPETRSKSESKHDAGMDSRPSR